jgi:hypothetical protein
MEILKYFLALLHEYYFTLGISKLINMLMPSFRSSMNYLHIWSQCTASTNQFLQNAACLMASIRQDTSLELSILESFQVTDMDVRFRDRDRYIVIPPGATMK